MFRVEVIETIGIDFTIIFKDKCDIEMEQEQKKEDEYYLEKIADLLYILILQ